MVILVELHWIENLNYLRSSRALQIRFIINRLKLLFKVEREVEGRRFPADKGIAGLVIKTGSIVNTRNPKEHPEFNPEIDSLPGVECKWVISANFII